MYVVYDLFNLYVFTCTCTPLCVLVKYMYSHRSVFSCFFFSRIRVYVLVSHFNSVYNTIFGNFFFFFRIFLKNQSSFETTKFFFLYFFRNEGKKSLIF